ncbi:hypothetical protein HK103_003898 [Boothiomyces macroporosus]|uniref:Uncharacterized protein n=1 Tax=Boothiomyces macroporosus TaxID=261099 RepID=A0AAD5UPB1_9FUNG|nr:hypothetical protein HK103_003898 [Boothiomyces macroporosus]
MNSQHSTDTQYETKLLFCNQNNTTPKKRKSVPIRSAPRGSKDYEAGVVFQLDFGEMPGWFLRTIGSSSSSGNSSPSPSSSPNVKKIKSRAIKQHKIIKEIHSPVRTRAKRDGKPVKYR